MNLVIKEKETNSSISSIVFFFGFKETKNGIRFIVDTITIELIKTWLRGLN